MSQETLKKLEAYKRRHKLSDLSLSKRLGVYHIYPYRWRKAGRIIGIYRKFIGDFLEKEAKSGR